MKLKNHLDGCCARLIDLMDALLIRVIFKAAAPMFRFNIDQMTTKRPKSRSGLKLIASLTPPTSLANRAFTLKRSHASARTRADKVFQKHHPCRHGNQLLSMAVSVAPDWSCDKKSVRAPPRRGKQVGRLLLGLGGGFPSQASGARLHHGALGLRRPEA